MIGHTGWTGTLTVIDRDNNLIIVWLTNAKNSPVIDPAADKNTFVGDMFLCKTYGTIPTLVYESMNGSGTAGMDALLAQLVEDKVNLMAAQPQAAKLCQRPGFICPGRCGRDPRRADEGKRERETCEGGGCQTAGRSGEGGL